MVSRFSEIVVDCEQPRRLAEFWCEVLGYRVLDEEEGAVEIGPPDVSTEDDWAEWRARLVREPSPPTIVFIVVPEGKTAKNRLHIDVSPLGTSQPEEVERLIALGATKADIGQGDVSWAVLRDPEGNEFCVLRSLTP
jgi:catechol 2,3-dioxygenase-like lactoylglutathione lyase family enzyme